mmetsp:Transcript_8784/g.20471  ORF Transcript_8784/g.20471 Transcript_8784/m.20471 type:complete len:697 (-) Transcript_8784:136-2226(-)
MASDRLRRALFAAVLLSQCAAFRRSVGFVLETHRWGDTPPVSSFVFLPRGGGIEANPDYEDPDSDSADSSDEVDASSESSEDIGEQDDSSDSDTASNEEFATDAEEEGSEGGEEEEDASEDEFAFYEKSVTRRRKSKSKKSVNKRVRKLLTRHQTKLYIALALFAFRRDILKMLGLDFKHVIKSLSKIFPRTINWSTDVVKLVLVGVLIHKLLRATKESGPIEDHKTPVEQSLRQKNPQKSNNLTLLIALAAAGIGLLFFPSVRAYVPVLLPLVVRFFLTESSSDTFAPPLKQHFAFEQLNERYYKDWKAWNKAQPVNSLLQKDQLDSDLSGLDMSALVSSFKKDEAGSRSHTSRQIFPKSYNNGTVIVMDMTELDAQVTKQASIRDQVSFLIDVVDMEKQLASLNATNVTTSSLETSNSRIEVVVLLESGGGGVSAYGLASSHLLRMRDHPLISLTVCVDSIAASGGYMMACCASPGQLLAAPFSLIGSIGVISQVLNIDKALRNFGIRPYVFTGGKRKNPVGLYGDVTKEGMGATQEMISRTHVAFKRHVTCAREGAFATALESGDFAGKGGYFNPLATKNETIDNVMDRVATGDVFLGSQALELGLVDRIMTSDEYISERMRDGSRVLKLVVYEKQSSQGLFSFPRQNPGFMRRTLDIVKNGISSGLQAWTGMSLPNFAATSSEALLQYDSTL